MKRGVLTRRAPLAGRKGQSRRGDERSLPRRQTAFPDVVKLACRTRAGQGDAQTAACEACGQWLGLDGGEVRPRLGHDLSTCAPGVVSGPANAVLLCGSVFPLSGCAGRAWSLDPAMQARGFLIRARTQQNDPTRVPVKLASPDAAEVTVWLTEDAGYLWVSPDVIDEMANARP